MTILISGAGSGIGKAIAQFCAQKGHTCILLGRNEQNMSHTLNSLEGSGHQMLLADIRSKEQLANAAAKLNIPLDGIVANSGVGGENQFGPNDRWDEIIDTNLTGTYQMVQTFLPHLRKSVLPHKQIVIISSVLARLGVANYAAYCASKAGLLGLMRSWAVQYAPEGILSNAICPGWVDTDMSQAGLQGIADGIGISKESFFEIAMQSVPLKKMSQPNEIAELVGYLLSQQSVTGQTFDINGGSVMNS